MQSRGGQETDRLPLEVRHDGRHRGAILSGLGLERAVQGLQNKIARGRSRLRTPPAPPAAGPPAPRCSPTRPSCRGRPAVEPCAVSPAPGSSRRPPSTARTWSVRRPGPAAGSGSAGRAFRRPSVNDVAALAERQHDAQNARSVPSRNSRQCSARAPHPHCFGGRRRLSGRPPVVPPDVRQHRQIAPLHSPPPFHRYRRTASLEVAPKPGRNPLGDAGFESGVPRRPARRRSIRSIVVVAGRMVRV